MMAKVRKAALLVIVVVAMGSSDTDAAYHPDHGDLCYDGVFFADSLFVWNSPGPWRIPSPFNISDDPGYEHDFSVSNQFFTACSSWTNLPSAYDDCPTAGVDEPSTTWTFSFGSFHIASGVVADRVYYGLWNFSGGSALTSPFTLSGQQVWHDTCPFDIIWCMLSRDTNTLLTGFTNWGGYPSCMFW
jgi:hypothetical protein